MLWICIAELWPSDSHFVSVMDIVFNTMFSIISDNTTTSGILENTTVDTKTYI